MKLKYTRPQMDTIHISPLQFIAFSNNDDFKTNDNVDVNPKDDDADSNDPVLSKPTYTTWE